MMKNIPCQLDKHCGHKELLGVKDHGIRNLGSNIAGTVTQRYYKGIMADADNMVVVVRGTKRLLPCKMNKSGPNGFVKCSEVSMKDLGSSCASSILATYYKGGVSDNANFVLVASRKQFQPEEHCK